MIDWLLDADPAIRWQALRDLADAPADVVAAERARVAGEGWGARILALQGADGLWEGGALFPARDGSRCRGAARKGQPWTATAYCLVYLQDFGIDPADERVRRAVDRVRANARWENDNQPYFEGETEPCINGHGGRAGRVLRRRRRRGGRAPGRRAARGRRLELRGRERLGARLVPHDHPGAGGAAAPRAGDGRVRRGHRGAAARRGLPPGSPPPPAREHGRGHRSGVPPVRVPHPLALRRASRLSSTSGPAGERPDARARGGHRARPIQAATRRHVAARPHLEGRDPIRDGGRRRQRRAAGTRCARSGCCAGLDG